MRFLPVLALCVSALWGQDTALLSGSVLDSSGAPVAKAEVRLASRTSSFDVKKTANQGGDFAFDLLEPGEYSLTVTHDGFHTLKLERIVLRARERQNLIVTLSAGEPAKTVTVDEPRAGLAAVVSTAASADLRLLHHLPVNGRNALSLTMAAPASVIGAAPEGQPNTMGVPHHLNYVTLDGLNLFEPLTRFLHPSDMVREPLSRQALAYPQSAPTGAVSLDSLTEVRLQAQDFIPQLARTPGLQLALISRHGERAFHGSVYEYFRTDRFSANDWFANSLGLARGRLRQHQFGAAAGGPIIPERTHFFASYEGLRLDAPQTLFSVVPDAQFRQSTPASLRPFLAPYPLPNRPGPGNGAGLYAAVQTYPLDRDNVSFRLDQRVAASHHVFGRFNYSKSDADARGSMFLAPSVIRSWKDEFRSGTAGVTSELRPGATNEFRINYTNVSLDMQNRFDPLNGAAQPDFSRIFPPTVNPSLSEYGLHVLGLAGYAFGPASGNRQWQINASDTVTMVAGAHSYVAGFDYRYIAPAIRKPAYSSVSYFRALSELQADGTQAPGAFLSSRSVSSVVSSNSDAIYPEFQNLSLFLQDTAKIGSRITLGFGVRWDINIAPGVRRGPRPAALSSAFSNRVVQNEPVFDTSWSDVAPRFSYTQVIRATPGRELIARFGVGGFHAFGASNLLTLFEGAPYSNVRSMSLPPFPLVGTDLAAPAMPPEKRFGLVVAPDRVGDGMPDDGDLPITRRSFHGRGRRTGWTDLRMMLESIGVLTGISNDPIHMTRWAGRDRLPDGRDTYPLYGDAARRRRGRPTLDGRLDRDEWQPLRAFDDPDLRAETFCRWDEDGLYLAARCSRPAEIRLQLDATANGWFNGSDNYWLNLFPDRDGSVRVEVSLFDWERFGQRDEMGRMHSVYRNTEKVRREQIRVATGSEGGRWVIEIHVPRNERTGLLPAPGAVIGLSWGFAHSREPRTLLALFEPCTFFPIACADGAVTR